MIDKREKNAIMRCVERNYWPAERECDLMEKEASKYLGTKYGILANSGSSAGLLALTALELPKGSEVIIPAVTFPTIFNIILQCGLVPVVIDSKIGTYNLDPEDIEPLITKKTKAIICVHAVGNPCDMPAIMKIAKKHNLYVIEDNCLAEGTLVKTLRGDIPIENVKVGDMALTRKGYRKVLRWLPRGEKEVITKLGITATPDHPFRTKRGLVTFDSLQPSDILYIWNRKSKSIEEVSIEDIPSQGIGTSESIGTRPITERDTYIVTNTKMLTARFLRGSMSTIKTVILSITESVILLLLLLKNILNIIFPNQVGWKLQPATSNLQGSEHLNGIGVKREENGIHNNPYEDGPQGKWLINSVNSVIDNIRLRSHTPLSSARNSANGRVRVYDLEVEEEHEFFANNILVKNCDGWGGNIGRKKVGSYGHVSFTSFHAAHIVAMGQGGGVFTNDKELARRVRMYRDWGRQSDIPRRTNGKKWPTLPEDQDARFIYEKIGYNLGPLELQAAMGRIQLKKTEMIKRKRAANFKYLYNHLKEIPYLIMPLWVNGADPSWFSFPITVGKEGLRAGLVAHLEKNGIETRSMFAGQILKHPAYRGLKVRHGDLSEAEYILRNSFWISCHPRMTKADREYVIKTFKDYCTGSEWRW